MSESIDEPGDGDDGEEGVNWDSVTNPYERVADDAPNRCQHVNSMGQCRLIQSAGSTFCIAHSGPHAAARAKRAALKNYRLGRYQARLGPKAGSPTILTLRDEVGIIRALIENLLNLCTGDMEQAIASSRISDLSLKVEKLAVSCDRLESKLSEVLAQDELVETVGNIASIIEKHAPEEYLIIWPRFQMILESNTANKAEMEKAINHTSNYQLGMWQQSVNQFSTSPHLKSLRDEIAIVRMLLEDRMNTCRTTYELMLQSGPIAEIVVKVEKLVTSCVRLEVKSGQVLDKNQQISAMQQIIEIISECIEDTDKLEAIHRELQ